MSTYTANRTTAELVVQAVRARLSRVGAVVVLRVGRDERARDGWRRVDRGRRRSGRGRRRGAGVDGRFVAAVVHAAADDTRLKRAR